MVHADQEQTRIWDTAKMQCFTGALDCDCDLRDIMLAASHSI
jgi:hypothetical protein